MTTKQTPPPHEIVNSVLKAAHTQVWLDLDGTPYVSVTFGGHREHFPVMGSDFSAFLDVGYLRASREYVPGGQAPGDAVVKSTQNRLRAMALEKRKNYPTSVRVAHHEGKIYYDLVNEEREVVVIDQEGYRIASSGDVPVRFVRPPGTLELPRPANEQDAHALGLLGDILGLSREVLVLVVLAALTSTNPSQTYPVLVFQGEKGSGKSTLARLFGSLLDPRRPQIASPPKNEENLIVTAAESHVYVLDNLSGTNVWLSDSLCRLSTGGGLTKRRLYSNRGVERFTKTVLTVLNGIDSMTDRDDLASRSIPVHLRSLSGRQRGDRNIQKEFDEALPRLLGALFSAFSCSLRELDQTLLRTEPRMLDAVRWAVAAESVLPFEPGEMELTLQRVVRAVTESNVEGDPVAAGVVDLLTQQSPWEGSMTALKTVLSPIAGEVRRMGTRKLTAALERARPALHQLGYTVTRLDEKEPETRRALYRLERRV